MKSKLDSLINPLLSFIDSCRLEPHSRRYASSPGGPETLYASSFAALLLFYLGRLDDLDNDEKQDWSNYLLSWQDPETGLFLGPEVLEGELISPKHSREHISLHLTAHVLPALEMLGSRAKYPLGFIEPFLDEENFGAWLEKRDWREAWLEGNNLLFIGQFLVYSRDIEGVQQASDALDQLFAWLDHEIDPATGLWGTNGYCRNEVALYGGYHQLLLYYYENRPVKSPERLVDIALSLQGPDFSFDPHGRGGACQDTDAIDILVNMYKLVDYKRPQIRIALRRSLEHVLNMQMPDGGFVNRTDEMFTHMGMLRTRSEPGVSNMFPTWFRVHSLALISEILQDEFMAEQDWNFNRLCSMGWHPKRTMNDQGSAWWMQLEETLVLGKRKLVRSLGS